MKRRATLLLIAFLPAARAFDQSAGKDSRNAAPVYVQGSVATLLWSDPQPFLEMTADPGARVPEGLAQRLPAESARDVELAALIARAAPADPSARLWRVQLPTLAELTSLDIPRPQVKDPIGVIGSRVPPVRGMATIRPAVLIIGERPYPLSGGR
jgi:hypothetical protein